MRSKQKFQILFSSLLSFSCLVFGFVGPVLANPPQDQRPTSTDSKQIDWRYASGKVVDANGKHVVGAIIYHSNHEQYPENTTKTDRKGEFTLKYQLRPNHLDEGWIWAFSQDHNIRCVSLHENRKDSHLLELPAIEETEWQVVDPAGGPISAEVMPFYYAIPNGVYASDETTGLSGYVPLELRQKLIGTADANGRVKLRCVPTQLLSSVLVTTADFGEQIIGTRQQPLQLVDVGSVTVRILPDEPIDFIGTKVSVYGTHRVGQRSVRSQSIGTIDKFGECKFEKIPQGEIKVTIKIDEERPFLPQAPPRVELAPDQDLLVEVNVNRTVRLFGQILAGDLPVARARISAGRGLEQAISDEHGKFNLQVFPRTVELHVFVLPAKIQKDYYYPGTFGVDVSSDQKMMTLDPIRLPWKETVTGKVVDDDSKPVSGYYLIVMSGRSRILQGEISDDGTFAEKPQNRNWKSQMSRFEYFLAPMDKTRSQDKSTWIKVDLESLEPLVFKVNRNQLEESDRVKKK